MARLDIPRKATLSLSPELAIRALIGNDRSGRSQRPPANDRFAGEAVIRQLRLGARSCRVHPGFDQISRLPKARRELPDGSPATILIRAMRIALRALGPVRMIEARLGGGGKGSERTSKSGSMCRPYFDVRAGRDPQCDAGPLGPRAVPPGGA